MSEMDVVKAIEDYVRKQGNSWSFVRGREVLTKEQMISKLYKDRKFRKFMVKIVIAQTIEILGRSPP
jgi:hypothetical protein